MQRKTPIQRTLFDHSPVLVTGLLFALGVVSPAQSGRGDLDVRFGTHGQTQVPGQVDSAALISLPDGRILVFGVPDDSAARSDGAIAVARLLANGQPDTVFGPGGHLDLRFSSEALPVPTDALLLADGRILVAGYFRGNEYGLWPDDQRRSRAPGWLVRLSPDALIDPTFGVSGVARIGGSGVDRIAALFDGAIAAAAPGLLYRLEPNGTPAAFPGSELSAIPLGTGYRISAMVSMSNGSLITSAGFSGPMDSWELSRVSVSGGVARYWAWRYLSNNFHEVASFARHRDGTRLMACGSRHEQALVLQRWQEDGRPDPTFASATGGKVELGVDNRPDFWGWRAPRCRTILPGSAGDHVVVGDWSRPYEYGGGRILLAHLDASGAIDAAFDRSGSGRELALGTSDQWSSWYVADAATASDGAALLIARRTSASVPDDIYLINDLGEQQTLIARVEVSPSGGVGSIGFNDAGVRIAERLPGELRVYRSGGTAGSISVRYELLHDTTDGADVVLTAGTLTWADGDVSPRSIPLVPVDDAALEGEERFRVRLSEATGGAGLGVPEIEVTIEDDDALRALQFAESAIRILEVESADVTIMPLAAAQGPIVVRYAVAPDLDPNDGSPRPTEVSRLLRGNLRVGELRWSSGDTSSRTLRVSTFGIGGAQPDETVYVALADVSGTLRDGNDWKVARITVVDDPALGTQPPPSVPIPSTPPPPTGGGGGGGALSLLMLPFLALALLISLGVRFLGAAIYRRKTMNAHSLLLVGLITLGTLQFGQATANSVGIASTHHVVVTTPAELETALLAASAGQRIHVRAGTYDLPRALVVPDHVTLIGEGRMQFDAEGLPSGFEPFTETILRGTAGLLGDVLTLGDGAVLRGLVIQDFAGRVGNAVVVSSRSEGDSIAATIAQCEIIAPNPRGVGPQRPTGHALVAVTNNLNMAAPPSPHVGAELSIDMRRTLIRSPGGAPGVIALGFASHSRITLVLTRNVVGHGLSAAAGVGRPDAVTQSTIAIESAHNLYLSSLPSNTSQGWRLVGGDTARLPVPSGASTANQIRLDSRDDRIEGFAVGIFAAGGVRFGELAEPSSQNSADLELTRLRLQSTVADLSLYGARSLISGMSAGDGNSLRVAVRRSTGSGGLANEYLNSFSPVMDALGVENRLVIAGNPNAFARTNVNIAPAPPAEFFEQCQ